VMSRSRSVLGATAARWAATEYGMTMPKYLLLECRLGTAHRAVQNAVLGAVAVAASTRRIAGLLRSAGVTMLIDVPPHRAAAARMWSGRNWSAACPPRRRLPVGGALGHRALPTHRGDSTAQPRPRGDHQRDAGQREQGGWAVRSRTRTVPPRESWTGRARVVLPTAAIGSGQVALNRSGRVLLACTQNAAGQPRQTARLAAYNASTGHAIGVLRSWRSAYGPCMISAAPGGGYLLVTGFQAHQIARIDLTTGRETELQVSIYRALGFSW
jgi:hypothetical protein